MVHVSELDMETVADPNTVVKVGDVIPFLVLSTDAEKRRFLSRASSSAGT